MSHTVSAKLGGKVYLNGLRVQAELSESASACDVGLPGCGAGCLSKMALRNGCDVLAQLVVGNILVVVQQASHLLILDAQASSVVALKTNVTVNYSTRCAVCVTAGPLLQAIYLRKEEPVHLIKRFIFALQAPFSK